ncbi:MAG: hypothetical protein AB7E52_03045 [Bdellovibrionales bacterium]
MTQAATMRISTKHLLVPMLVMAFTMALFFVFQMTQIMRDRDALNQTFGRQTAPFEQSQKLNAQFGGLVVGTQKLAEDGNKSAVQLTERLKQIGVIQTPSAAPAQQTAPVPVAMEKQSDGPVKP